MTEWNNVYFLSEIFRTHHCGIPAHFRECHTELKFVSLQPPTPPPKAETFDEKFRFLTAFGKTKYPAVVLIITKAQRFPICTFSLLLFGWTFVFFIFLWTDHSPRKVTSCIFVCYTQLNSFQEQTSGHFVTFCFCYSPIWIRILSF